MDSFPLLDREWIPTVTLDGQRRLVSLRESLLNAALYRRIDAGHPLQTPALYRLHLAILHRALRGPKDEGQAADWYLQGFPREQLETYLDAHAARFHLFGPQPFMQVAGLDPAHEGENFRSHWARISGEQGSANTTALFNVEARPGGSRSDALTPEEAALRLVEHQTFALGGLIKRFTTAARAAPIATAALFLAEGSTLHQTLCLNLVPYRQAMQDHDLPSWERPQQTVAGIRALYDPERPVAARGYVSRYMWPSRSVLLLPEETPEGLVVRTIGFGAGEPLEGLGEGAGANVDPMVTLRTGEQPFPYKLRRDRLLWRDLTALLPDPAQTVKETKGKAKPFPGRAPETLLHAGGVMRTVAERVRASEATRPPLPSQTEAAPAWAEGTADARAAHPVIPMLAFGQLTDQGKAFAMRQESYTLPEAFIQNPENFRNHIGDALGDATALGDTLRQAVRRLATALLGRGGEREPHKDDVSKLASQIPAELTYWAGLEAPFRTYLLALDSDPAAARQGWHHALSRAGRAAWRTAEEAAGLNAVGLRAVQVAGRPLFAALAQFKTEDA
ncbi:type I-E CRISPR-associated protein Cse1/CasA [Deinococcus sp. HMF7604]|uniref:type I-E CRISPR-associated protein Cse1/CasA n=1 Tax=Deinococcus betulae TaxID=2873312 RepID=UPI001CD00762|nr:type I-E CRISPR-associated protein Cse1/CasA [Deinococcus betulae]MBZ9751895.1 type I-E CRISPR-associated protein Cse1/CasA [Deinococcus betulae]